MEKIFVIVIILYALFVGIYFLYLRAGKRRKKNIVGEGSSINKMDNLVDIVGKSQFVLLQVSPPKEIVQEGKKAAAIPPEELDETFANTPSEEEDNLPMDITVPLEYEDSNGKDGDEQEDDDDNFESGAPPNMASGLDFNALATTVKTVDNKENATSQEKQDAGKVLTEIQQTDMFEQLVSSTAKPNRSETVKALVAEHLAAYHAKLDTGNNDTHKAPVDFDIRNFV